jgi:hypothetical protein
MHLHFKIAASCGHKLQSISISSLATCSHVKISVSSSYRPRSLYDGMSSILWISSIKSSLSSWRRVDFMTVCSFNNIVEWTRVPETQCVGYSIIYGSFINNKVKKGEVAIWIFFRFREKRTYIEVHVSSMHVKPLLIHQLEGYAVENVKSSIIFWTTKIKTLNKY